ncbi:MAG: hypothetical protein H7X84_10260 [Verrucomicrobia bacterium]|nr:hypothetical protein [Prolixibacteraceae bacterium]
MIEEKDLNKLCYYYEMFMERAFGRYELPKPVLQASGMKNLIMAEKGIVISLDSMAHFEEQLIEIKKHIETAFDHYMCKPNVPKAIIEELKEYKDQVVWAVSSDELMKIVFKTIDITANIFIEME